MVLATWSGCTSPGGPTGETNCSLAQLDLSSTSLTISVRETVSITPEATEAAGSNCTDAQLTNARWSSGAPNVASVDSSGTVTGVSEGTARITATLVSESASLDLEVTPSVATSVAVTPSSRLMGIGHTFQFRHVCRDAGNMETACPTAATWRTSPASSAVASVDGNGLVTANADGTVAVTATVGSMVGTANVTVSDNQALLFQMDLSAGAFPQAGFDGIADPATNRYSVERVEGIGPSGQPAYRLTVDTTAYRSPGQPYLGWSVSLPSGAPFVSGGSVFIRFRMRWIANTRCESWDFDGGNLGSPITTTLHRNKFHIINDAAPGGNREGRAIIQIDCESNSSGPDPTVDSVSFSINRANGSDRCMAGYQWSADATWLNIQYQHTWSSANNVPDGTYKLWVNNNSQNSPTCDVTGLVINTNGEPNAFRWGFYMNNPPRGPIGRIGYELTDYEIGTGFDPTWNN